MKLLRSFIIISFTDCKYCTFCGNDYLIILFAINSPCLSVILIIFLPDNIPASSQLFCLHLLTFSECMSNRSS